MIVNIGTGAAPVNIASFISRSAALIDCKMLQNTKLSIKLHHCTLSELKTQIVTLSEVLACVSIPWADQKKHPNWDSLRKSMENPLQTCADIANEYLHAHNTGVKIHAFCSLHQCKCAGYTMFLITFVLSIL